MKLRSLAISLPASLILLASVVGCSSTGTEPPKPVETIDASSQATEAASDGAWEERYAACLRDKGWDAVSNGPDGGVDMEWPTDQTDKVLADQKECQDATGVGTDDQLTADELAGLYEKTMDAADCLEDEGFAVAERPSVQMYQDTYYTDAIWDAYGLVPGEQLATALDVCPEPRG